MQMHDIIVQIPPYPNFASTAGKLPTGYQPKGHRDLTHPTPAAGTATASHGHRPEPRQRCRRITRPAAGPAPSGATRTTAEACTVYLFACPEGKSSARGERGRQSKPNGRELNGDQHQDHADDSRQQDQRNGAAKRTGPGHRATGKEENHQDRRSDHYHHGDQKPGHRIEARQLPADHPASTRRTPATPPAIRHQVEPPGRGSPGPPCSLPATSTTRTTTTTGSPAAIRTGGSRQEHTGADRQQGQEQRSEPGQGTRPRTKKRNTHPTTAAKATTTAEPAGKHQQPPPKPGTSPRTPSHARNRHDNI